MEGGRCPCVERVEEACCVGVGENEVAVLGAHEPLGDGMVEKRE